MIKCDAIQQGKEEESKGTVARDDDKKIDAINDKSALKNFFLCATT